MKKYNRELSIEELKNLSDEDIDHSDINEWSDEMIANARRTQMIDSKIVDLDSGEVLTEHGWAQNWGDEPAWGDEEFAAQSVFFNLKIRTILVSTTFSKGKRIENRRAPYLSRFKIGGKVSSNSVRVYD